MRSAAQIVKTNLVAGSSAAGAIKRLLERYTGHLARDLKVRVVIAGNWVNFIVHDYHHFQRINFHE